MNNMYTYFFTSELGTIFMENLGPGYKISDGVQQNFFSIFSIFFPAVAGTKNDI